MKTFSVALQLVILCFGAVVVCNNTFDYLAKEKELLNEALQYNPNIFSELPPNHPLYSAPVVHKKSTRAKVARAGVNSDLPYSSFTEINKTVPATGYLSGYSNDTASYFLHVGAGEVVDLTVVTDETETLNMYADYQVAGTQFVEEGIYMDMEYQKPNKVLFARHCLSRPATYFFTARASNPVSYTISMATRKPTLNYGTISGSVLYITQYSIPVTAQCRTLLVDITLNYNIETSLNFECRQYDDLTKCPLVGATGARILTASISSTNTRVQYLANCTQPGNYYLMLNAPFLGVNFNLTVQEEYPCESWCRGRGICNLQSKTCTCMATFPGVNCSSTAQVKSPQALVDIPVNGAPFTYSNTNLSDALYPVRLVYNQLSPGSVIRLTVVVQKRATNSLVYLYFNPNSPATTSNYSTYEIAQSTTNDVQLDVEIRLCASASAWYIGFSETLFPNSAPPTIVFTASVENAAVTGNSFNGRMGSISTYFGISYSVYYFQAPSSGYVYVRADEDINAPNLNGIYSVQSSCGVFNKDAVRSYSDANGAFQLHYQSVAPVTAGLGYYIVLAGSSLANYSVSLDYSSTITACPACVPGQGICTVNGACVCKWGWKGADCSQIDYGSVVPVNSSSTQFAIPISTGKWSQGAYRIVLPQQIPTGFNMYVSLTSTSNKIGAHYALNALPNPYDPPYAYINTGVSNKFYLLANCVAKQPLQHYMLFNSKNTQQSGSVQISTTLVDARVLADGNPHEISGLPLDTIFGVAVVLPNQCAGGYHISISRVGEFTRLSDVAAGGKGTNGSTCIFDTPLIKNSQTGIVSGIISSPTDCSLGINFYFSCNNGNDNTVSITVTPTSPCPNACSGNGQCVLGGICKCVYPFIGADCSAYDSVGSPLAANLTTCKGNYSIAYQDEFDTDDNYCDAVYDDAFTVPKIIQNITNIVAATKTPLSASCQAELKQIICDYFFAKTQPQVSGGSKIMLPCNCYNFTTRCIANFSGGLDLLSTCAFISQQVKTDPLYVCNPNPGPEGRPDPVVTTTKASSTAGGTGVTSGTSGTLGTGSTTKASTASTTKASGTSGTSGNGNGNANGNGPSGTTTTTSEVSKDLSSAFKSYRLYFLFAAAVGLLLL